MGQLRLILDTILRGFEKGKKKKRAAKRLKVSQTIPQIERNPSLLSLPPQIPETKDSYTKKEKENSEKILRRVEQQQQQQQKMKKKRQK